MDVLTDVTNFGLQGAAGEKGMMGEDGMDGTQGMPVSVAYC